MEIKCGTEKQEESGSITEEHGSTNQHSSEESEKRLSSTDQLIIGVVFGALVLLLLILVSIWYCKRRKTKGNWFETLVREISHNILFL